jgi:tetratricopeptide (TPR) repeat protein
VSDDLKTNKKAGSQPLDPQMFEDLQQSVAWDNDWSGEALIIGDLSEVTAETAAAPITYGAVQAGQDGEDIGLLLYPDEHSVRRVSPEARPRLLTAPPPGSLTPYEEFLIQEVDGQRTIRELTTAGLFASAEITATVLALVERGILTMAPFEVDEVHSSPRAAAAPWPSAAQLAEDLLAPVALAPPSADLEPPVDAPLPELEADFEPAPDLDFDPEPQPIELDPSALQVLEPTPSPLEPPVTPAPPIPSSLGDAAPYSSAPAFQAAVVRPAPSRSTSVAAPPRPEPPRRPLTAQGAKANKLYEAAMADYEAGRHVSALMNIKLAIAFDGEDERFQKAFRRFSQEAARNTSAATEVSGSAQPLFERGCQAESAGDIDRAIALFTQALAENEDAAVLNRLGVILAMRKGYFNKAQRLLQKAVQLEPHNTSYQHNLEKVKAAALRGDAPSERSRSGSAAAPRGLLGRAASWIKR